MQQTQDEKLNELLEMMRFMTEHAATTDSVKEIVDNSINGLRSEMNAEITNLRSEMNHGFGKVDESLVRIETRLDNINAQLELIHKDLEDIKARLAFLEKKVQQDGNAYAADIIKLRERVDKLERQIQQFMAGKLQAA